MKSLLLVTSALAAFAALAGLRARLLRARARGLGGSLRRVIRRRVAIVLVALSGGRGTIIIAILIVAALLAIVLLAVVLLAIILLTVLLAMLLLGVLALVVAEHRLVAVTVHGIVVHRHRRLDRPDQPEIMLGVLKIILGLDPISRRGRVAGERQIFVVNLVGGAADAHIRPV